MDWLGVQNHGGESKISQPIEKFALALTVVLPTLLRYRGKIRWGKIPPGVHKCCSNTC